MIPVTVANEIRLSLLAYLTTTFRLNDEATEQALLRFLTDKERGMFRGSYLNVRLPFEKSESFATHPTLTIAPPFAPYRHQERAWSRLSSQGQSPRSTLITTGTGSGKTECFLYPILDHCYAHRHEKGIKAIILYPMNALAADQAKRLANIIHTDERLRETVRAGLYVGGKPERMVQTMEADRLIDDRDILRHTPPDILLTNYKMLDFLLLRPDDAPLWGDNREGTLRYLVLDELHSYDGAQGSDVACLIRRLKTRLQARDLCAVGTSATVGEDTTQGQTDLLTFAAQIFGVPFDEESVIGELRMSKEAFLPQRPTYTAWPAPEQVRAQIGEAQQDYLARLMEAWFGERELSRVALGERLSAHQLLHELLERYGRGVPTLEEIETELSLDSDLLTSFLALVSYARRIDGGRSLPFLTVQVQLWLREISRLMRVVSAETQFFWRDDRPMLEAPKGLPMVVCRECGQSGLLTAMREGDEKLSDDAQTLYRYYFDKNRHLRYLYLNPPPTLVPLTLYQDRVCPRCLRVTQADHCEIDGSETLPALIYGARSDAQENQLPKDLRRCPACTTDDALFLLGSQAASLSSVAISHLFTTPLNNDKKLLAFTDSVQDASHRAAFFGARTYRFGLRTAIQATLRKAEGDAIPIESFLEMLWQDWNDYFHQKRGSAVSGAQKFVAVMMPPDLREWSVYRDYMDGAAKGIPSELAQVLRLRLSWELLAEYGFNAKIGRSLEKAGSSCAFVTPDLVRPACETISLTLQNEIRLLAQIDPRQVAHFVRGLLDRTRFRGGIIHPWFDQYIRTNGQSYQLSKRQRPFLPTFPIRYPRFLTTRQDKGSFDSFVTTSKTATWFSDWARRVLSADLGLDDINTIYRLTLERLAEAEILESSKGDQLYTHHYGIKRESLRLTRHVGLVRCDVCRDQQTLPQSAVNDWEGQACLRFQCRGVYHAITIEATDYYHTLYQQGEVERIFTHEHTGLLARDEREKIEQQFREGVQADAPNLLVATPTLEMGIDIGDLSATLVTAIPPTTANYLQRIGRAGRSTGNALVIAIANTRPHDLYFFADPYEMIAGAISAPGCFLNAPRMLERQWAAFVFDRWAQAVSGQQLTQKERLPRDVKGLLNSAEKGGFPHNWVDFFMPRFEELIERFLGIFDDELNERTVALLRLSAEKLPQRIFAAIEEKRKERKRLIRDRDRLSNEIKKIENDPACVQDPEFEKNKFLQERRVILNQINRLEQMYILEFFTDVGLLPNYAFPETGVKLTVWIGDLLKGEGKEGKKTENEYETAEYMRPAPTALRELAPFNTFYAQGRKVPITHLQVASKDGSIEKWQFCPRCAYIELMQSSHYRPNCPQCHSPLWSDRGQQHDMVLMRQMASHTTDQDSLTADDAEDRNRQFYEIDHFFHIPPDSTEGAYLLPDPIFGIEYLHDVTLREVNFGLTESYQASLVVAEKNRPLSGYSVCPSCGVVYDPKMKDKVRHTRLCTEIWRSEVRWQSLYLYREVTSEALRILLPVSTMLVEEKLATMQAAFGLGLREKFKGRADHLHILPHTELSADGIKRRYLVLYDTVPGGTSFLRDLADPKVFHDLLQRAYQRLSTCSCQDDPFKKACYRCLYSYQSQYDLTLIDRRLGLKLLEEALNGWERGESVTTLSQAELGQVLESELEQKVIEVLRAQGEKSADLRWREVAGKRQSWELEIGRELWRIEPQRTLSAEENVSVICRPDFIFYPQNKMGGKPVALFADGATYHIQPDDPNGRIGDDLTKRMAIIQSGEYLCWTVTWDDVNSFANGEKNQGVLNEGQLAAARKLLQGLKCELGAGMIQENKLAQLLAYLRNPTHTVWQQLGMAAAMALMMTPPRPPIDGAFLQEVQDRLASAETVPVLAFNAPPAGETYYYIEQNEALTLLLYANKAGMSKMEAETFRPMLRLDDTEPQRKTESFAEDWAAFWRWFDLWQFLPQFAATTTTLLLNQ